MSSDPRVHKPRLPKAYTDQQISFLRSHLPEFERRSQGSIRGDAKKFALERAQDFIVRFGLPDEFVGIDEPDSRFKEQIYNWFKNTVGRTRRKLEGRPRSAKKAAEKGDPRRQERYVTHSCNEAALTPASDLGWNTAATNNIPNSTNVVSFPTLPDSSNNSPVTQSQATLLQTIPYGPIQTSPSMNSTLSAPGPSHINTLGIAITQSTLREAFMQGLDSSTIANMIQSFVGANPGPTPLTPVVDALFEAISGDNNSPNPFGRDPLPYLKIYLDASHYFNNNIVHAGVAGPYAGPRALQMQIRKNSVWTSTLRTGVIIGSPMARNASQGLGSSACSISDEMQRIALDRQRRKDHIHWARIHAAALELNMLSLGRTNEVDNTGYSYAIGRAFSEMTARDAVWEADEVEWVAGICVLRAVIRTGILGDRRQRDDYDELLRTYEGRWKEIKDEARQALVTEILLSAKDELTRLENHTLS